MTEHKVNVWKWSEMEQGQTIDNNALSQVMYLNARVTLTESCPFYLVLSPICVQEESECHFAIS